MSQPSSYSSNYKYNIFTIHDNKLICFEYSVNEASNNVVSLDDEEQFKSALIFEFKSAVRCRYKKNRSHFSARAKRALTSYKLCKACVVLVAGEVLAQSDSVSSRFDSGK